MEICSSTPQSKQIKILSNSLLTKINIKDHFLKLNDSYKTSEPLDHQLQPIQEKNVYNGHNTLLTVSQFRKPIHNDSVPPLPKVVQKLRTDEKKNLSKHHLILPNNTQICVETLLSQCGVNDEQIERKFESGKVRGARIKKKKLTLFKPKNFLLKNGKLRPIVTTNIKSGVFRSVEFDNKSNKKNDLYLVPSNVLYSQSTLPSRIQSIHNFSNDKWVIERTTKFMPNDWTRAIALNSNTANFQDGDSVKELKKKDFEFRNEQKGGPSAYNGHDYNTVVDFIRKPTIHRLVTPDGFHLSIVPRTTSRFTNQFFQPNFGSNTEFKHPLQQSTVYKNEDKFDHHNMLEDTPICRTRFSRATRSPLQHDTDEIDKVNVLTRCQQHHTDDATSPLETFTEKIVTSKNSTSDRNRCKTCRKLYLGRRKVIKHLKAFPDHEMAIPPKLTKIAEPKSRIRSTTPSTERLFDFLIQKIKNAPIDEKSHILFREISDFVEKLETIRSQLLCDDNTHSSVEYLDKHCSKIFGTQEGNYHISLDILDQLASGIDPNEFASNVPIDANILPNQLDHNINVSLSSISESKIHLVEGISEESLLKTVDDLMRKEGRMVDGNFDHIEISDNAVEAVTLNTLKDAGTTQPILNLSLDLFKFDGT